MKTPITDRTKQASRHFPREVNTVHADLAERLELDRAALMEALANLERRATFGTVTEEYLNESRRALAAARANFPTP